MKAFTEWARSINVIKIRLAGYYQSFVKDFSKVATSLTNLLRKTIKLEWTEKCEKAFQELK